MERPRMNVGSVTVGADPAGARELADFYHRLLGWPIVDQGPPDGGWAQLRPPEGESGMTINIEADREYRRPVWPSSGGEQIATMHLDIGVADLDAAVAWALEAGARLAEHQPQEHVRVMLDPHGHPFCLF
jgi:catechol 2,3-dioxygenase-like lactoylglutathione lyase family enzyme